MHDLTESQQVTFPSVCEFHNLAENMAASCTNSLQLRMEMDLGHGDDFCLMAPYMRSSPCRTLGQFLERSQNNGFALT